MSRIQPSYVPIAGVAAGRGEVAVAGEAPGAVHVPGLRPRLRHQEAELRGARQQPQN